LGAGGLSSQHSTISSTPPCSGCVSSLFRCCRLHVSDLPVTHYPTFYATRCSLLHTPKPIRPYTNLILESEIPDRNGCSGNGNLSKRKRSWSRAVFSNLQRKGLEKRFQMQKYITKPDRRQLAATLGLTDAQVKVWFQNRRMKWRHNKELKYHNNNNNNNSLNSMGNSSSSSTTSSSSSSTNVIQKQDVTTRTVSINDKAKCSPKTTIK
ncbi:uncharacterized protein LOC142331505, partial [Lycorma delicatula]|uniref:uncharacterized protein LOC142331505 n=1 Tax=Lycorma delicatula TaxID=130591 RepID=UPI003F51032B